MVKLTVGSFGLVLFVWVGLAFVLNLRAEKQARSLLNEIRDLTVGESTEIEIQNLVDKNGGESGGIISGVCDLNAKSHSIMVTSPDLDWIGSKAAPLRPFGNRVWAVQIFLVTSKNRLCFKSYDVRVFLSRYNSLHAEASTVQGFGNSDTSSYFTSAGTLKSGYIRAVATTDATAEQRQRAFDFDLSCLMRFGGCRSRCELMPSAWADYVRRAKENGWNIPAGELANPKCQKQ